MHNLAKPEVFQGRDGARQFWADYLGVFDSVRSEFTRVVADDTGASMEWEAEGTLKSGKVIGYSGVSAI